MKHTTTFPALIMFCLLLVGCDNIASTGNIDTVACKKANELTQQATEINESNTESQTAKLLAIQNAKKAIEAAKDGGCIVNHLTLRLPKNGNLH